MENKIQIVRAYWGVKPPANGEIFPNPVFEKERVYVWGVENEKMFTDLGYDTRLMCEYPTDPKYSTIHTHFYHKLEAIVAAERDFEELIFLDWDNYLARPLDDEFYKRLRDGGPVQVPVYSFPDKPLLDIPSGILHFTNERYNNSIDKNTILFIESHERQLRKYNWPINNMLATPNFGFYYSRKPGTALELLKVSHDNKITNCVEEHAMFVWSNCTLEEYLQKYEPSVTQGSDDNTWQERQFFEDQTENAVYKINKYITSKIDKKIYFRHI